MSDKTKMIDLRGVEKRYGSLDAVQGIDLTIYEGEVYGFLGPNGAGKTTTMKMIAGLLRPDGGTVEVGGINMVTHPVEAKRILGYIPDRPFLYEKLTAWEFLHFIAALYEIPDALFLERGERLLKVFGMSRWRDTLIEGFSHGMKQRIVMAAAFLHEPRVLVVDEPMVGLDPAGARLVKEVFKEWAARGNTVLLSTHTLEVAEEVCDRMAIIYGGKVLAQGTVSELRETHGRESSLEGIFLQLTGGEDTQDLIRALKGNQRPG